MLFFLVNFFIIIVDNSAAAESRRISHIKGYLQIQRKFLLSTTKLHLAEGVEIPFAELVGSYPNDFHLLKNAYVWYLPLKKSVNSWNGAMLIITNQNSCVMLILLFILDFLTPPADHLNDNNEASTVVDIDSLTRGPVNGAEQASTSSRGDVGSAVVLNRQITNLESTTYGALNLTEGAVSNSTNRSPITGTNAAGRPAGTIPSRSANLINSQHDHTSSSQHDCHHHDQNQNDEASGGTHHDQDEPSPSTSTSSTYDHEKKKNKKKSKEVLLCAGGESNANRTCSSSSSNIASTSFTRHGHAMTSNTVDQPNSPHDQNRQNHNNLEPFLNFLREQELSRNLTQIAIAVATCLYGNSEAIHPTMRMALVMLLSVGVQCFWCGTLRRNVRIEQLGHVLIIAALYLLLANLMLPSPWALIPAVTFMAFLITLGIHFRRELG